MKKLLFLIMFAILFMPCAKAEKLPIKITPTQLISTHHNEVEVGDWIKFKVVNDVFYKNKLYIKKDTQVIGVVDQLHENGYAADNAEIVFDHFFVRNVGNELIKINYTLTLNRDKFECEGLGDRIVKYIGVIFRGNEIKVLPESAQYNIFLTK